MEYYNDFKKLYQLSNFQETLSKKEPRNARLELLIMGILVSSFITFTSFAIYIPLFFENDAIFFFAFMGSAIIATFSLIFFIASTIDFFERNECIIMYYSLDDLIEKINVQSQDPTNFQDLKTLLINSLSKHPKFVLWSNRAKRNLTKELHLVINNYKKQLNSQEALSQLASDLKNQNQLKPDNPMALFFKNLVKQYNEQVETNKQQAQDFSQTFKQAGIEANVESARNSKPLFIKETTDSE